MLCEAMTKTGSINKYRSIMGWGSGRTRLPARRQPQFGPRPGQSDCEMQTQHSPAQHMTAQQKKQESASPLSYTVTIVNKHNTKMPWSHTVNKKCPLQRRGVCCHVNYLLRGGGGGIVSRKGGRIRKRESRQGERWGGCSKRWRRRATLTAQAHNPSLRP